MISNPITLNVEFSGLVVCRVASQLIRTVFLLLLLLRSCLKAPILFVDCVCTFAPQGVVLWSIFFFFETNFTFLCVCEEWPNLIGLAFCFILLNSYLGRTFSSWLEPYRMFDSDNNRQVDGKFHNNEQQLLSQTHSCVISVHDVCSFVCLLVGFHINDFKKIGAQC